MPYSISVTSVDVGSQVSAPPEDDPVGPLELQLEPLPASGPLDVVGPPALDHRQRLAGLHHLHDDGAGGEAGAAGLGQVVDEHGSVARGVHPAIGDAGAPGG